MGAPRRLSILGKWPAIGLVALLVSFYLLSAATQNSELFGRIYAWLLFLNAVGLIVLSSLVVANVWRLYRQYRAGVTGVMLTIRLMSIFVLLAITPVGAVYYFSLQFLHKGMESWFDVRIEDALSSALALSQSSLDERVGDVLKRVNEAASLVGPVSDKMAALGLSDIRTDIGAEELTLYGKNSRIIAVSSQDPTQTVPSQPSESIWIQIRDGKPYAGIDPVDKNKLLIRVVVPLPGDPAKRTLQALYPLPSLLAEQADRVETAVADYKKLQFLREPLRYTFTAILSLVLLLGVAFAVWAAFISARRLTAPIRDLADGTRAVAAGDYSKHLPKDSDDELGQLVDSFNSMTQRLQTAREVTASSRQELESQRAYLEAVLARLSSGVLSLDEEGHLRTANSAASDILDEPLHEHLGESLATIPAQSEQVVGFLQQLHSALINLETEWSQALTLMAETGRQVLMCRAARLSDSMGYVVVFDDVTALVEAQRDAAWSEVARRLAHEIKNPLTPIQLSAERLRHKCLPHVEPKQAEILDRATHTIIEQVRAMGDMVKAFSDYARPPQLALRPLDLNALVTEVLDLYRLDSNSGDSGSEATENRIGELSGYELQIDLGDDLPGVQADSGRLRQLIHNLIKNAHEAISEAGYSQPTHPKIRVLTRCQGDGKLVELIVCDNGPGIPEELLSRIFEPYVTDKKKGTGLGLSIVKKIVEEHNGILRVRNGGVDGEPGGAQFIVQLPAAEIASDTTISEPVQTND